MGTQLTGGIIDAVEAALWSEVPDIAGLHARIEHELCLSPDATRALIYEVASRLNAGLFPPITKLELIHTEGCNLACDYCFEKNMLGWRTMPTQVAIGAVDLLFNYSQNERDLSIVHFGGEPTLNFAAIQRVTEYAEKRAAELGKSLEFDMTTNGVLLSEATVDYFAQHNIKVLLSVDGLQSSHDRYRLDKGGKGTFSRVMKALELLKRVQPWIGVKMTVMPANAARLFDDVLGLYDLGVNQFIIGYATGIKWPMEEFGWYQAQLERVYKWYTAGKRNDLRITEFDELQTVAPASFGCQAGRISVTVSVTGEISPCSKILALNNRQLLSKLGDVTYGITHLANRSELVSCSRLRANCETAGIADDYQGGCFASNYEDAGALFKPSLQDHAFSLALRSVCAGCSSATR
jgi:uncharacterized protein